jgi:hypothetical protein
MPGARLVRDVGLSRVRLGVFRYALAHEFNCG